MTRYRAVVVLWRLCTVGKVKLQQGSTMEIAYRAMYDLVTIISDRQFERSGFRGGEFRMGDLLLNLKLAVDILDAKAIDPENWLGAVQSPMGGDQGAYQIRL